MLRTKTSRRCRTLAAAALSLPVLLSAAPAAVADDGRIATIHEIGDAYRESRATILVPVTYSCDLGAFAQTFPDTALSLTVTQDGISRAADSGTKTVCDGKKHIIGFRVHSGQQGSSAPENWHKGKAEARASIGGTNVFLARLPGVGQAAYSQFDTKTATVAVL
ncbi:hypothetical protein OG897_40385 [Streptomyces sp. NBC_00237]|uniref:hypothetical protein n=1 Tax=Streptomyces sp. NBC_00237 TaxID=2975687 RepID=UPI00225531E3|nr:hypothetical protein [Streptomyces sp. NBC_00237]MCX5207651.1 hypothetical protein [Streptomyces sp. NBC_00237]